MEQQPGASWYKLDNAAKIYPATRSSSWNSTFRLSAVLTEEIDKETLSAAVYDLKLRFPTFYVQLRSGLFWYSFEPAYSPDIVGEERNFPCTPIEIGHRSLPVFRVIYYKNRISLEVFHAVADGTGALIFMKTLLARYLSLRGKPVEEARWELPDPLGRPTEAEAEDGFTRYYEKPPRGSRREPRAYQNHARRSQNENYIRLILGRADAAAVNALARAHGATITQYLAALYILSFAEAAPTETRRRPVRVSVPVNLRKFFPSETLRNFSLYVNTGVVPTPGMSVDDILAVIIPELKAGFEPETLRNAFSANVAAEKNPFMRAAPLFIKVVALRVAFRLWGESRYTSAFSNLGAVSLPECMRPYVTELQFSLGCSPTSGINLSAVSYGGRLCVAFTSRSADSSVQERFFRELTANGIAVEVESND